MNPLLKLAQNEFPVAEQPFAELGEKCGLTETQVIDQMHGLMESGQIRRLGVSFNPRSFGYVTTLVGAKIESNELETALAAICAYPEVTHCYERTNDFNVWFTLIVRNNERKQAILKKIETVPGITRLIDCPAPRIFKIDARFDLKD